MNDDGPRMRWRWVGIGLLLLQLGWVVALPPFGAMDEWDHAYRASAVVHGQWVAPPSGATRGTGAFVSVPTDIVRAAQDECERLRYGGVDECIGTTEGAFTEVASGAGRYPPLFYALVGWPSLFLDGVAALYGMRLVGLLLCGALLLASLRSLARWGSALTGLTLCLGLTPSVMYAGAAVAPNGLEMVSGVALWTALATIAHDRRERALDGLTVMLAVVSASLLLSLRSLGPLWAALVLALALLAWPPLWSRLLRLARTRVGVAVLSWLVAVSIGSVWWIRTQGSLEVGSSDAGNVELARRLQVSLRETVVWTFQFMGAFPYRNNPSRPLVYLFLLVVIVTLLVLAFRSATRRERWALTTTVALSYAVPFAISVATVERFGTAWQGRYALPFLLGTLLIAGVALGRRITAPKPWALCLAVALTAAAHTIATVHVLRLEHKLFERTSTPYWALDIHPAILATVVLGGSVALSVPFVTTVSHQESTMNHLSVPATVVSFGVAEREAAMRVLESGRVVQGAEVAAFETEFADVVAGRDCIAVNSGTSALHLALLGAGIGQGDEVIVPSFSFAATANAVVMAGATPVFADIDRATFCLDPDSVASRVTGRTAAIMPVHLYGQVADMVRLRELADRAGVLLVEDAAQAHAAGLDGVPAGAWGDLAAFSFYATKNMTTGEGGMVVSADPAVTRRIRLLRNQGMERQYENEIAGLNNRMTDLAAAIGRVQLRSLDANTEARIRVAGRYRSEMEGVEPPLVVPGARHVFHQYTVRSHDRDRVLVALAELGVEARVFYPIPIHRLPAYAASGDDLPETDAAAASVLSLPMRPTLTDHEVDHVIHSVFAAVSGEVLS